LNSDSQFNSYLNKLNKMANMNILAEQQTTPTESQILLGSPFNIATNSKMNGYLLYLQLPKSSQEQFNWEGTSVSLYASLPVKRSLYQHKNNSENRTKAILYSSRPNNPYYKRKKLNSRQS
jgi:hypothetical protein